MARAPFDQFAQRIVTNGETEEFLRALLEYGLGRGNLERITDKVLGHEPSTQPGENHGRRTT